MIFAWAALVAALGRGLSAGLLRTAGSAGRVFGGGASRFAALRATVTAKRFAAGAFARQAMRGGSTGAISRIALAGMAHRRAKRSGKRLPKAVLGFVARDFMELSRSLTGLPGKLKNFADGIANGLGGLSQFSGQIAQSRGHLLSDRIRRTSSYARDIAGAEAYNNRAQSRLEEALLPYERFAAKLELYSKGFLKNLGTFALDSVNPSGMVGGLTPKLTEEQKASLIKRGADGKPLKAPDRIPDDWWTGPVPTSGGGSDSSLIASMNAEIAAGVYHTRKMHADDIAKVRRDISENLHNKRRYAPLPPVDDGKRN